MGVKVWVPTVSSVLGKEYYLCVKVWISAVFCVR